MSFAGDIARFARRTRLSGDLILRRAGLEIYSAALAFSPVRTGRFRASHRLSRNSADLSVEPPREGNAVELGGIPPTGAELAKGVAGLGRVTWKDTVIISNNLPYANRLESGWSKQAPAGVYKPAVQAFQARFPGIVNSVRREVR